ncbi:MAG: DUF559 domain-containing protein [Mycobacteriales bacterium]|nr:DUF559 domain-containing protein [Mycobacteriales bacterium]
MAATADWDTWLARNRTTLVGAKTPYEWTFANLILSRVTGLSPDAVQVQGAFTDLDGMPRRMDFAVVDGSVRVAIEVDGFNKVPGTTTGMTSQQFSDFLRRQTALSAQGWMVLRFANSDFTKDPARCIRQIELALQQARAVTGSGPGLSSEGAAELQRLRQESNDVKALEKQLRQVEGDRKRAQEDSRKAQVQAAQALDRQRQAEEAEAAGRQRRLWLIGGLAVALIAAGTTGALYASRERLPGVAPASPTSCPSGHPIKGNRSQNGSTKIYHVPSGVFYARTTPVRCFATEDEAVASGYRRSAR